MATPLSLGHLPSLWKQHLLSEFAGLKQACPEGVFVSMNPGDAALWSAVLFVRDGPYATAVLRFIISFPDSYPRTPPLVTFQTDMFHPLITPLTTHMYATELQMDALGGTADQEMLPPGGFSLRHGFPEWYQQIREKNKHSNGNGNKNNDDNNSKNNDGANVSAAAERSGRTTPTQQRRQQAELPRYMQTGRRSISTYSILKYIRSTFDKEEVLDSIPLSASGNPGAWHAWRTHRRKQGKVFNDDRTVAAAAAVVVAEPTPSQTPTETESRTEGHQTTTPSSSGDDASTTDEADGQGQQKQVEEQSEPTLGSEAQDPDQDGDGDGDQAQQQAQKRDLEREQKQPLAQGEQQPPAEEKNLDETVRRPEDWNWEGVWEDRVKKGIAVTLSESVLYGAAGGPESLIHFLALENEDIQTVKENLRRTLGMPV